MATTFSTAKVALDLIAQRIQQNRNNLIQAQSFALRAETDLTAMPTQFGTIISDINSAAAAAPSDAALQSLKLEKDKLVSEFTSLQATATSMKNATAAITV